MKEEKKEQGCGCASHKESVVEEHTCCCHHSEGCCHHGHKGNHEHSEPVNIVKLIDDEGKEHECLHIATIEFQEKWYAIFQAMEEDDADEDTVTILQIVEENGEERLIPIAEQSTLDAVFEEFCRLMDEEEE